MLRKVLRSSFFLNLVVPVDPPQFQATFAERTLQPGPSESIKCQASGNPVPEITWELDGKKVASAERSVLAHFIAVFL